MGILFSCFCLHEIIFSLKMSQNLHHSGVCLLTFVQPSEHTCKVLLCQIKKVTAKEIVGCAILTHQEGDDRHSVANNVQGRINGKEVVKRKRLPVVNIMVNVEPRKEAKPDCYNSKEIENFEHGQPTTDGAGRSASLVVKLEPGSVVVEQGLESGDLVIVEQEHVNSAVVAFPEYGTESVVMNATVQGPKEHACYSEATLFIDNSVPERHGNDAMGRGIAVGANYSVSNAAWKYIKTKMRTLEKWKHSSFQSASSVDWLFTVLPLVLYMPVMAKLYRNEIQSWKPYVKKQKRQDVYQNMKKTRGQSVSPDKRNVLRCPLSCTASGKKPCSTVVWLFFGVLCLCFLKTFAAPDTVKPKPCELNVTLDESFFLHCYVPDNAIYVHWSRFYTSPKRIEYLYNSKDKRFLKNDTNFTAFPNGTIVFQSANFSDTAEYHCIVLLAGSGDNETKLYVCVQNSSANVANVIPEENPDSKSPDVIGPAVGGGFGALIFCLVIGSLVRYLYKRKRRLASRNNNQEGNDGELKENDITEPLRNRESAKILNCIEATRQSNGTAESPMNGGVSNGLLMVSEGTTQSSGTTKPLIPDGGQH